MKEYVVYFDCVDLDVSVIEYSKILNQEIKSIACSNGVYLVVGFASHRDFEMDRFLYFLKANRDAVFFDRYVVGGNEYY